MDGSDCIEQILHKLSSKARRTRINALKAIGPESSEMAFSHVVKLLSDSDKDIRFEAARTLARLADKRAVEPLAEALQKERLSSVRHAMCAALGHFPSEKAATTLLSFLEDKNENVRYWATKSLGRIGEPAVEHLIHRLGSQSWNLRRLSAEALVQIGKPAKDQVLKTLPEADENRQFWLIHVIGQAGFAEGTETIAEFLKSRNRGLRINAAKALGALRARTHILDLVVLLKSSHTEVRNAAAEALAAIGAPAIMPLVKVLSSKYWHVRQKASEVLSKIAVNQVLPVAKCLAGPSEDARFWAAKTLAALGDIRAVRPLVAFLPKVGFEVKGAIIEALSTIGDPSAIPELVKCLSDRNEGICHKAAKALGTFGGEAIPYLIFSLGDKEYNMRKYASMALRQIGEEAVDSLVDLVDDPNPDKSYWAARTLGQMGKKAVEPLRELLNSANSEVRILAINALKELKAAECVDDIEACLKDEFWSVRKEAAQALGEIGSKGSVERLINALEDEDEVLRAKVAEALGRIGDPSSVKKLVGLCTDVYAVTRQRAIEAMGRIGDSMGFESCLSGLSDSDEDVVDTSVQALAALKEVRAVPRLLELLQEEDFTPPRKALLIAALGELGDPRACRPLMELVDSPEEEISSNAARSLYLIGDFIAEPAFVSGLRSQFWTTRKHCSLGLSNIIRKRGDSRTKSRAESRTSALDDTDTQFKLGTAFARKGMLDEAIVSFNKAISLNPKNVRAMINLGLVFEEKNMLDDAVGCFKNAIKLEPGNPAPHLFLGVTYGLMGSKSRARGQFRKVMDSFPGTEQARIAGDLIKEL